jgi:hypothetical protein
VNIPPRGQISPLGARSEIKNVHCSFFQGDSCNFAHGVQQLRTSSSYKTMLCKQVTAEKQFLNKSRAFMYYFYVYVCMYIYVYIYMYVFLFYVLFLAFFLKYAMAVHSKLEK